MFEETSWHHRASAGSIPILNSPKERALITVINQVHARTSDSKRCTSDSASNTAEHRQCAKASPIVFVAQAFNRCRPCIKLMKQKRFNVWPQSL